MPRVPGEEGKKKEPPAYMGDPNATTQSVHLGASTAPKPANLRKCASRASTPHGGPTEQGLHEVGQAAAELVPAIQAGLADGTLEASDRLAGTLAALLAEVQRARAPRPAPNDAEDASNGSDAEPNDGDESAPAAPTKRGPKPTAANNSDTLTANGGRRAAANKPAAAAQQGTRPSSTSTDPVRAGPGHPSGVAGPDQPSANRDPPTILQPLAEPPTQAGTDEDPPETRPLPAAGTIPAGGSSRATEAYDDLLAQAESHIIGGLPPLGPPGSGSVFSVAWRKAYVDRHSGEQPAICRLLAKHVMTGGVGRATTLPMARQATVEALIAFTIKKRSASRASSAGSPEQAPVEELDGEHSQSPTGSSASSGRASRPRQTDPAGGQGKGGAGVVRPRAGPAPTPDPSPQDLEYNLDSVVDHINGTSPSPPPPLPSFVPILLPSGDRQARAADQWFQPLAAALREGSARAMLEVAIQTVRLPSADPIFTCYGKRPFIAFIREVLARSAPQLQPNPGQDGAPTAEPLPIPADLLRVMIQAVQAHPRVAPAIERAGSAFEITLGAAISKHERSKTSATHTVCLGVQIKRPGVGSEPGKVETLDVSPESIYTALSNPEGTPGMRAMQRRSVIDAARSTLNATPRYVERRRRAYSDRQALCHLRCTDTCSASEGRIVVEHGLQTAPKPPFQVDHSEPTIAIMVDRLITTFGLEAMYFAVGPDGLYSDGAIHDALVSMDGGGDVVCHECHLDVTGRRAREGAAATAGAASTPATSGTKEPPPPSGRVGHYASCILDAVHGDSELRAALEERGVSFEARATDGTVERLSLIVEQQSSQIERLDGYRQALHHLKAAIAEHASATESWENGPASQAVALSGRLRAAKHGLSRARENVADADRRVAALMDEAPLGPSVTPQEGRSFGGGSASGSPPAASGGGDDRPSARPPSATPPPSVPPSPPSAASRSAGRPSPSPPSAASRSAGRPSPPPPRTPPAGKRPMSYASAVDDVAAPAGVPMVLKVAMGSVGQALELSGVLGLGTADDGLGKGEYRSHCTASVHHWLNSRRQVPSLTAAKLYVSGLADDLHSTEDRVDWDEPEAAARLGWLAYALTRLWQRKPMPDPEFRIAGGMPAPQLASSPGSSSSSSLGPSASLSPSTQAEEKRRAKSARRQLGAEFDSASPGQGSAARTEPRPANSPAGRTPELSSSAPAPPASGQMQLWAQVVDHDEIEHANRTARCPEFTHVNRATNWAFLARRSEGESLAATLALRVVFPWALGSGAATVHLPADLPLEQVPAQIERQLGFHDGDYKWELAPQVAGGVASLLVAWPWDLFLLHVQASNSSNTLEAAVREAAVTAAQAHLARLTTTNRLVPVAGVANDGIAVAPFVIRAIPDRGAHSRVNLKVVGPAIPAPHTAPGSGAAPAPPSSALRTRTVEVALPWHMEVMAALAYVTDLFGLPRDTCSLTLPRQGRVSQVVASEVSTRNATGRATLAHTEVKHGDTLELLVTAARGGAPPPFPFDSFDTTDGASGVVSGLVQVTAYSDDDVEDSEEESEDTDDDARAWAGPWGGASAEESGDFAKPRNCDLAHAAFARGTLRPNLLQPVPHDRCRLEAYALSRTHQTPFRYLAERRLYPLRAVTVDEERVLASPLRYFSVATTSRLRPPQDEQVNAELERMSIADDGLSLYEAAQRIAPSLLDASNLDRALRDSSSYWADMDFASNDWSDMAFEMVGVTTGRAGFVTPPPSPYHPWPPAPPSPPCSPPGSPCAAPEQPLEPLPPFALTTAADLPELGGDLPELNAAVMDLIVSHGEARPDPSRLEAMAKLRPEDFNRTSDVETFLGVATYYKELIPNFADVVRPLHLLLRERAGDVATKIRTTECRQALDAIHAALLSPAPPAAIALPPARCTCALTRWCPRHDRPIAPRNSTWCPLGDIFLPGSTPYGGLRVEYAPDPHFRLRAAGSGHHDVYGHAHVLNGLVETGLNGEPLAVVRDLRHAVLPGPDEYRELLIEAVSRALVLFQRRVQMLSQHEDADAMSRVERGPAPPSLPPSPPCSPPGSPPPSPPCSPPGSPRIEEEQPPPPPPPMLPLPPPPLAAAAAQGFGVASAAGPGAAPFPALTPAPPTCGSSADSSPFEELVVASGTAVTVDPSASSAAPAIGPPRTAMERASALTSPVSYAPSFGEPDHRAAPPPYEPMPAESRVAALERDLASARRRAEAAERESAIARVAEAKEILAADDARAEARASEHRAAEQEALAAEQREARAAEHRAAERQLERLRAEAAISARPLDNLRGPPLQVPSSAAAAGPAQPADTGGSATALDAALAAQLEYDLDHAGGLFTLPVAVAPRSRSAGQPLRLQPEGETSSQAGELEQGDGDLDAVRIAFFCVQSSELAAASKAQLWITRKHARQGGHVDLPGGSVSLPVGRRSPRPAQAAQAVESEYILPDSWQQSLDATLDSTPEPHASARVHVHGAVHQLHVWAVPLQAIDIFERPRPLASGTLPAAWVPLEDGFEELEDAEVGEPPVQHALRPLARAAERAVGMAIATMRRAAASPERQPAEGTASNPASAARSSPSPPPRDLQGGAAGAAPHPAGGDEHPMHQHPVQHPQHDHLGHQPQSAQQFQAHGRGAPMLDLKSTSERLAKLRRRKAAGKRYDAEELAMLEDEESESDEDLTEASDLEPQRAHDLVSRAGSAMTRQTAQPGQNHPIYGLVGTGKVPPMPGARRTGHNRAKDTAEKAWPLAFLPSSQSGDPHTPVLSPYALPANSKFDNNRARVDLKNALGFKTAQALGGDMGTLRALTANSIKRTDSAGEELSLRSEALWIKVRPPIAYAIKAYLHEEGRPERVTTAIVQALSPAPSLMAKMEDLERELIMWIPRPDPSEGRDVLRAWAAFFANMTILGLDVILIPDHQPRDRLARLRRRTGDSISDLALSTENTWVAVLHASGRNHSRTGAYSQAGMDAVRECHAAFITGLRRGDPDTCPEQLADWAQAKLKSRREHLSHGSSMDQVYDRLSVVQWASEFEAEELSMRSLWRPARSRRRPVESFEDEDDPQGGSAASESEDEAYQPGGSASSKKRTKERQRVKENKALVAARKEIARLKESQGDRACVTIDGEKYQIDYDKLIDICRSSPEACARLRLIGAPPGDPKTWCKPIPTITDPDKEVRKVYKMGECWRCKKQVSPGEYRKHSDPKMAALNAGHDPRWCIAFGEAINAEPLLKPALVKSQPRPQK